MHPHIAGFMATDRIDSLTDEAARERLARSATRSKQRPSLRERLMQALRRRPIRPGHRRVVRHA